MPAGRHRGQSCVVIPWRKAELPSLSLCTFWAEVHVRIPGKRVKRVRWVHTDRYFVAVEVEAVNPIDDPSEP